MNILFTSADPGSAQQNDSTAHYFKNENSYKLAYISSNSSSIFYSSNYTKSLIIEDQANKKDIINDFISIFMPDFIFLGLSSKKSSIDYIICEIAKKRKIRTGVIQDYYGWIGSFNISVKPDHFFVIDDYAKKLTQNSKICDSDHIVITGSPKHYNYFNKINEWKRNIQKLKFSNKEMIFFLQPLSINGIKSNFNLFCKTLDKLHPGYRLNIKPHPLDLNSNLLIDLKNKFPINIISNDIPAEILLLYFKNIVNCYSTIALDYYFITKYLAHINQSRIINLLIGHEIKNTIKKLNFDIKKTPQYDIGINIFNKKELRIAIKKILNNNNNFNSLEWKKINPSTFSNPFEKIKTTIHRSVA